MSRAARGRLAALGLAAAALAVSVGVLEVAFRRARFDFDFRHRAFERLPIFYRQPIVPLPNGLFRRPGPDRWEGRVLTPYLRRHGVPEAYLPEEAPITVRYDAGGFRNPVGLDDWTVVVAGDSFTELGHLPDEQLFTTRLGVRLGVRVKNLGVSWTGPFSQTTYLESYGRAPSARHAVLAFFEGNDLDDTYREADLLEAARRRAQAGLPPVVSGTRLDQIVPQSSFVKALWKLVASLGRSEPALVPNAFFETPGGPVPVTISYAPPEPAALPGPVGLRLAQALEGWARTAQRLGMRPWLLYLPTKHSVLHGHLRFTAEAEPRFVDWQPGRLPVWIRDLAERRGVAVVDATAELQKEAGAGRLPYMGVGDTHLNALGAEVVARVLAEALGPALTQDAHGPP